MGRAQLWLISSLIRGNGPVIFPIDWSSVRERYFFKKEAIGLHFLAALISTKPMATIRTIRSTMMQQQLP